jgi:hypothetical protein
MVFSPALSALKLDAMTRGQSFFEDFSDKFHHFVLFLNNIAPTKA